MSMVKLQPCNALDTTPTEVVKTEKNLIQTEYQLNNLLDYIPDIILVHQDGKIRYANKIVTTNTTLLKRKQLAEMYLILCIPTTKSWF